MNPKTPPGVSKKFISAITEGFVRRKPAETIYRKVPKISTPRKLAPPPPKISPTEFLLLFSY